jgi:predicted glycoside hydrolase/deacetylase ChbG (UPF0249 family)
MNNKKLIINADDFGYNSNVNAAIVDCFQKKIINSATIMVNMDGFEEAIILAKQNGFDDKIGLHINLTEGKPLTNLSGTGLVDNNGLFIMKAISNPRFLFSSITKNKIKNEIRAQYDQLVASGINPSHFDSHQHVHILPSLVNLFIEFTREKNQKLRVVTLAKRKNFFKIIYHIFINMLIKSKKINFTDKFGNVKYFQNYLLKKKNFKPVFEIMVHPAIEKNKLIDILSKSDLEKKLKYVIDLHSIRCLEKM